MQVSWIAAIGPTLPSTWKAVLVHATQRMADLASSAGDATLFAVSNMALALGSTSSKCSYKDLYWQRMIDHIAAEIWIVTVRLGTLVGSPRTRQQRVAARLCRRNPIVFPAAPCAPVYRVEEFALNPRCASIKANPDFGDVGVARPSGTENGVGTIRFESLIHTGARDLRFQLHLRERPADGCSLGIIPIAVVGGLPVALKRLRGRNDVGEPLYRRHAIVPRHNGAQRISVIGRQILPVHLVGDQHVGLHRPRPRDTASIRDRTRRLWLFLWHAAISAFQNEVAHIIGQSGAFQQHGKGNTRPFGIADRPEFPLRARRWRHQEYAAVAGALQCGDACP